MNSMFDILDTLFIIEEEKKKDNGEDSFCSSLIDDKAFVAVFDGSGGMGFRKCPNFANKTEAYMASRLASGAFYEWFRKNHDHTFASDAEMLGSIKATLDAGFSYGKRYNVQNRRISGTMVRDFPTTAAIAMVTKEKKNIKLDAIWAGDSRVYILDKKGMAQLSIDDVRFTDAFKNLTDDGAMTNVLSADGNYELRHRSITLSGPTIVLAVTDGCYGYIPSPMEFEYSFLKCLIESETLDDFKLRLKEYYKEVASDDFAMGFMAFDFGDFMSLKSFFEKRYKLLEEKYMEPIRQMNDMGFTEQKWNEYKTDYERYFKLGE